MTRKVAVCAQERVFARPASPPFDTMTDDEIMEFVDREIAAYAEIGFTFFVENATIKAEIFRCS